MKSKLLKLKNVKLITKRIKFFERHKFYHTVYFNEAYGNVYKISKTDAKLLNMYIVCNKDQLGWKASYLSSGIIINYAYNSELDCINDVVKLFTTIYNFEKSDYSKQCIEELNNYKETINA